MKKDARGLRTFLDITDGYGTKVRVKESSAASSGPHLWIFVDHDPLMFPNGEMGSSACHLSIREAKKLAATLLKACDEHYQVVKKEKKMAAVEL